MIAVLLWNGMPQGPTTPLVSQYKLQLGATRNDFSNTSLPSQPGHEKKRGRPISLARDPTPPRHFWGGQTDSCGLRDWSGRSSYFAQHLI